ncbi:pyridoxal phosphate-dependent aminotransferase [Fodinisporobacter ferrooxydans]|uniref:cysteine-S-conjugate beta-lyase n=1 Tax=Fodinisporobacter ferrooxydans TaxID=2901836 RepID=A0ABY4CL50_9BACL|nr:pyridoxal phosphate-dependent aminotransferase [Alicyclobacillaceae bacterium MYW30-H2]
MDDQFDNVLNRFNTHSMKWDQLNKLFGSTDVLPMWVADMDFVSALAIRTAIDKVTEHGVFGYPFVPDTLREAIQSWLGRRHNWPVETDWFVFCPGVVTTLALSIETFSEPGDKIIIQPPVYPPFKRTVEMTGRELVNNPLIWQDDKYVMDYDGLEQLIDAQTKILVLCNPHNPVGRVWTKEELQKLGEICEKHGVMILSDEIHCDIVYPDHPFTPFASVRESFAQHSLTCMAATKTFNIAGLPFSYAVIPNATLRRKFQQALLRYALHMFNSVAIAATEAAYQDGEPWLDQLLQYLKGNVDTLLAFVKERIPEIRAIRPEGTYLIWLDFRALELSDTQLGEFLTKEAKVGLNLGHTFGAGGEGFARINIGCPRTTLLEGLSRIEAAVQRIKR